MIFKGIKISAFIFIGGEFTYSSGNPDASTGAGITIDRAAGALGTVNGVKFLGTYLDTSQVGGLRANGVELDGTGCQFMNMHIEGFPSPMFVLTGDAIAEDNVPNYIFGGGADFLRAEDDLDLNSPISDAARIQAIADCLNPVFLFADTGEVALRGFEDPVRLFEVRWQD